VARPEDWVSNQSHFCLVAFRANGAEVIRPPFQGAPRLIHCESRGVAPGWQTATLSAPDPYHDRIELLKNSPQSFSLPP
jgi:hypothetical protein